MSAVTVPADHPQTEDGKTVAFDHKTGNEWWVEGTLSEPDASSVVRVEAQDTGGPWVEFSERSWGAWAASFHVEDGSIVEFRATSTGGETELSSEYLWPEATQAS